VTTFGCLVFEISTVPYILLCCSLQWHVLSSQLHLRCRTLRVTQKLTGQSVVHCQKFNFMVSHLPESNETKWCYIMC